MDAYAPLLERTRAPQPALQKYAVTAVFSKLRSAPSRLGPDSDAGRNAISECLHSSSPPVADQSARELCRLVVDGKLDLSVGFLELQSALEGSGSILSPLFVKSLGFLTRLGFRRNPTSFRFPSTESHPFVKILSCGVEVQEELAREVVLFMGKSKEFGMENVCNFMSPFLYFCVLRVPFSPPSSSYFLRGLVSSMASFCCSFPGDALPVLQLLTDCFKFLPHKNVEEFKVSYYFMECVVEAYTVVLRQLTASGLQSINVVQQLGVELAEAILSSLASLKGPYVYVERVAELVKQLFEVQKDLHLSYLYEIHSVKLSLLTVLLQSELEHEQLALLKLFTFLLKWKDNDELAAGGSRYLLDEELLLIFPVVHLMSSASRSVKGVARDVLSMLEKHLEKLSIIPSIEVATQIRSPAISSPGSIIYRFFLHLLSQDMQFCSPKLRERFRDFVAFYLLALGALTYNLKIKEDGQALLPSLPMSFSSNGKSIADGMHDVPNLWASRLREYCLHIVDKRKSSITLSKSEEIFLSEMPLILSCIAGALVMNQSLEVVAVDLLTTMGSIDPKQGVSLLLAVLFYCNILTGKCIDHPKMLPKLLSVLPSLASHTVMIPLVIQTIMPMLQKNDELTLYASGIRLLSQTWVVNDRVFASLQAVLLPKGFDEFKLDKNVCLSMAASVRDVCKRNPDRGVDLILSVSACIESRDPVIQALGCQSLSHLCEADVIDFYTAWNVISKDLPEYSTNPVLSQSICLLLRWGAMDAEAYSEESRSVLGLLWDVCTSRHSTNSELWARTRLSAFESLAQYEVSQTEKVIHNFKRQHVDLLIHETNLEVLRAMEELQVKIILHEHTTRRRLVKEKRVARSKIEKLLDVVPQVLFPSGRFGVGKFPGAALLCLSWTPKDVSRHEPGRLSSGVHAEFEATMIEIAASLQLSRNLSLALLSLQSWKFFMRQWMRANILALPAKASYATGDKTAKAATAILKSLMQISEEAIPRTAENVMLAIGALCAVLPPSNHAVKSSASTFLLNWLSQYEHEYRQWSAAISIGLVSSCLHATDHEQKSENINGLLEVLCTSKSTFVKGACGVGLGFSCQDLLTRIEISDKVASDNKTYQMQEIDLLVKIVGTLLSMISKINRGSSSILGSLSASFPHIHDVIRTHDPVELLSDQCEDLEEDVWGIAGLVLGLGSCIEPMFRAGALDAMLKLKEMIISWIPHANSLAESSCSNEALGRGLTVGACLAVPNVVAFCRRVEVMMDIELDYLVNGFSNLISELLSIKMSSAFHQSLLTASCIGAGELLSFILTEGVHSLECNRVKALLELFRQCYSSSYHANIHLAGMVGVVNAMGAGVSILVGDHQSMKSETEQKDSSHLLGHMLSSSVGESYTTALIQEIFLVAQNSDDLKVQQNAAWAVSFLRNSMWNKEISNVENNSDIGATKSKIRHSFFEDSSVLNLSEWLLNLNVSGTGTIPQVSSVVSVLRCLAQAPRLPAVDWGSIVRRCMRYEGQVSGLLRPDSASQKGALREQCLKFLIAHANQFDVLLSFLDELSELSRFRTLELNLQCGILLHLGDLMKIFSVSRLDKLFDAVCCFFSSDSVYLGYNSHQQRLLKFSCWTGLHHCLNESSFNSSGDMSNVGKCIEVLFLSLSSLEPRMSSGMNVADSAEEWHEAVKCLSKVPRDWLLNFLIVPLLDLERDYDQFNVFSKKIIAKAKLVRIGCIPVAELGMLKAYILNTKSNDIWNVLVEVAEVLQHAEGSVKRQWVVDTIEISCISRYPTTAIQFLGLLSGSISKFMPILTRDRLTVLSDLPVTLTSVLSEPAWEVVAESVVSGLWISTQRVYHWVSEAEIPDETRTGPSIYETLDDGSALLLKVMLHTCVSLKGYLPLEKLLKLANWLVR